jgi:hypothetical protein
MFQLVHVLWWCRLRQTEAAHCKPEGHGFNSQWCDWNSSLTWTFWSHYGPGVESDSNRTEYKEYFLRGKDGRCIRLTTLPPSCADCLEIWEPPLPGMLRACNRPAVGMLLNLLNGHFWLQHQSTDSHPCYNSHRKYSTVRLEICCSLRLPYVDLVQACIDITSNTFYKCTVTFWMHCIRA